MAILRKKVVETLCLPRQPSGGSRSCGSLRSAFSLAVLLALDSPARSVGVDHPATSREASKPPGDSEDQHDDAQGKQRNIY